MGLATKSTEISGSFLNELCVHCGKGIRCPSFWTFPRASGPTRFPWEVLYLGGIRSNLSETQATQPFQSIAS